MSPAETLPCRTLLTITRSREPPLGGVAIQVTRSVLAAWVVASRVLLAMTARIGRKPQDPVSRQSEVG
jgi:hypothetical protein